MLKVTLKVVAQYKYSDAVFAEYLGAGLMSSCGVDVRGLADVVIAVAKE
ncbi:MAG: hypothetical protein ACJ72T_00045 [Nitrososphaeraceae archaeon]